MSVRWIKATIWIIPTELYSEELNVAFISSVPDLSVDVACPLRPHSASAVSRAVLLSLEGDVDRASPKCPGRVSILQQDGWTLRAAACSVERLSGTLAGRGAACLLLVQICVKRGPAEMFQLCSAAGSLVSAEDKQLSSGHKEPLRRGQVNPVAPAAARRETSERVRPQRDPSVPVTTHLSVVLRLKTTSRCQVCLLPRLPVNPDCPEGCRLPWRPL